MRVHKRPPYLVLSYVCENPFLNRNVGSNYKQKPNNKFIIWFLNYFINNIEFYLYASKIT